MACALLGGSAWFVRQWLPWLRFGVDEVAIIEPPALDMAGVDPAVVRAIESTTAAVRQSPRSAEAWGHLGKTLLAHGFYMPGSTCLARAERLDQVQARWPYLQGIALASADPPDPAAAIEKFQRATELGGDSPDVLRLRLAEALLAQDRLEEADQQFHHLLQANPTHARAHLGLARLAIRRGDPEKSSAELDHAAADPRTKKACRLLRAEVEQRLGKELSRNAVRETAQLPDDSAWPDPYWEEVARLTTGMKADLRRAATLFNQGQAPAAISLLQQVVRNYPDAYYAWLTLGRALVRQRSLKAAEQALSTALKLAPDSAETQFHLGVAFYLQGNHRGAEALFRRAAEVKPDYAEAHYNLGHCLLQRGDRTAAAEAFRTALRCKPDYADAHTSLSQLLVENGQHVEALVQARLALQFNPADATAKKLVQRVLGQMQIVTGP